MTPTDRDPRTAPEPLISDTDIFGLVESVLQNDEVVAVWDVHRLMIALRDEYEAERAAHLARIAAIQHGSDFASEQNEEMAAEIEDLRQENNMLFDRAARRLAELKAALARIAELEARLMTPSDPDPRTRYVPSAPLTPTSAAIAAYRAWRNDPIFVPPPTVAQVRLIAQYCQEYVNQYTYPVQELNDLRRRVVRIKTLNDLAVWLWDCRQMTRLEPL